MIIRAEDRRREVVEHMRGGDGCIIKQLYEPEEMPKRAKMFAELRIEPGCSIGTHCHQGEYEVFFYKEGELVLDDNGVERVMHPGDFSICRDGEVHGIANHSDRPASVFAVILKTED